MSDRLHAQWARVVNDDECEFKDAILTVDVEQAFCPPYVRIDGLKRGSTLEIRLDDLLYAVGKAYWDQ